jgi:hypothetical protein
MSTRAQVRFATREAGQSFNEHPEKIHAQFYVHHDGYPEGLGLNIAESLIDRFQISSWEIEHVQTQHTDLDYIYYIWSDYDKDTFLSIFEMMDYGDHEGECIFVGKPDKLINRYSQTKND